MTTYVYKKRMEVFEQLERRIEEHDIAMKEMYVRGQAELDSLVSSMEAVLSEREGQEEAMVTLYDFRQGTKLTVEQG